MRKAIIITISLVVLIVIGGVVGFEASGGDWSYIFPAKVTESVDGPVNTPSTQLLPLEAVPDTNSSQPNTAAAQHTPVPQVMMPTQTNYWRPVDTTIHLDLGEPTNAPGWTPPTIIVPPTDTCHAAGYVCDLYGR